MPRSAFNDRRLVTLAEVSRAWAVDRETLARHLDAAGVVPTDDIDGEPRYPVGAIIRVVSADGMPDRFLALA